MANLTWKFQPPLMPKGKWSLESLMTEHPQAIAEAAEKIAADFQYKLLQAEVDTVIPATKMMNGM